MQNVATPPMRPQDLFDRMISGDCDRPNEIGNPRKIIICTTPRTGGHSWCQGLRQLELGVPTEYFQWQYALPLMRRWAESPDLPREHLSQQAAAYGAYLLRHRSVKGLFSAKIFFENLAFMRQAIGPDDSNWNYVHLTRKNKTDQTISLLALKLTGRPFDGSKSFSTITMVKHLDEQVVARMVKYLSTCEKRWIRYLRKIEPERQAAVAYEDFVADPGGTMSQIMGRWFPQTDFSQQRIRQNARYRSDSLLKQEISAKYGSHIDRLWADCR